MLHANKVARDLEEKKSREYRPDPSKPFYAGGKEDYFYISKLMSLKEAVSFYDTGCLVGLARLRVSRGALIATTLDGRCH